LKKDSISVIITGMDNQQESLDYYLRILRDYPEMEYTSREVEKQGKSRN